jgi:hypothetical protein
MDEKLRNKLDQPAMPKIKGALSYELFLLQRECAEVFETWLRKNYGDSLLAIKSYQDGELYGLLGGCVKISFREFLFTQISGGK